MYSTKFLSFLGYIRIEPSINKSFYSFPIPVIGDELNSRGCPIVLGLDCPNDDLIDHILESLMAVETDPDSVNIGVADLQLAPHILCPFLYLKTEHLLLSAPIYVYSPFIQQFLLNSKLVQNSTLQIEVYSGNIEILNIKLFDYFEPKLLIDSSNTGYSRFPMYEQEELIEYINDQTFPQITYSLIELISESE